MFKHATGAALALLLALPAAATETPNYCEDPTTNHKWAALIEQHPTDYELAQLAALRRMICDAVLAGEMSLETGTRLFEAQRERYLNEARKREDRHRYGA